MTTTDTHRTIAAAVLTKLALLERHPRSPSGAAVEAWSEVLASRGCDHLQDALDAVRDHAAAEGRPMTPADVVARMVAARRDRAVRDPQVALEARVASPATRAAVLAQLANLGRSRPGADPVRLGAVLPSDDTTTED